MNPENVSVILRLLAALSILGSGLLLVGGARKGVTSSSGNIAYKQDIRAAAWLNLIIRVCSFIIGILLIALSTAALFFMALPATFSYSL